MSVGVMQITGLAPVGVVLGEVVLVMERVLVDRTIGEVVLVIETLMIDVP